MGAGKSREPVGGGGCCGPGQRSRVLDQGGGGEDWETEWESGSTNRTGGCIWDGGGGGRDRWWGLEPCEQGVGVRHRQVTWAWNCREEFRFCSVCCKVSRGFRQGEMT